MSHGSRLERTKHRRPAVGLSLSLFLPETIEQQEVSFLEIRLLSEVQPGPGRQTEPESGLESDCACVSDSNCACE